MDALNDESVGKYLQEHPDFLTSWFADHKDDDAVKSLVKKLNQVSISSRTGTSPIQQQSSRFVVDEGMGAPASVTEYVPTDPSERRVIKKYRTFSKDTTNSTICIMFKKHLNGEIPRRPDVTEDLDQLNQMSQEDAFMTLIRDIASELDVLYLCHKILRNVTYLTKSDRGSLFLVRGSTEKKYLVSKLFDVTMHSKLEDSLHTEKNQIVVPFGCGIVGHVAQSKETINIRDVYADPRFNQEVDKKTGYRTRSMLSMPVLNYDGEVIGVAQIINKLTGNNEFTQEDEVPCQSQIYVFDCPQLFQKYLIFCGIGITNAQLFQFSLKEFTRNQKNLKLAREIFQEQGNLEMLVQKIMVESQKHLKCVKCSVYLLEDSFEKDIRRFTKHFRNKLSDYSRKDDMVEVLQDPSTPRRTDTEQQEEVETGSPPPPERPEDVHFMKAFELYKDKFSVLTAEQIAASTDAYVARLTLVKGEPLNIELATDDVLRTDQLTDEDTFVPRYALCMLIHNSDGKIIGITQLTNKEDGKPFDENDEQDIQAFAIFIGLGIHNCQMYENACQLMAKQSVALEVLTYHTTANKDETETVLMENIPSADTYSLYIFDFDDDHLPDCDTIKATIRMFMEANLINKFKIPYEILCRWVCTVKKNYRDVKYHNWRHAFNVCQTMFAMLYTGELRSKFDDVEMFALMTACLCHDLDHRGTNNDFQIIVSSPMALLYTTSVLEHHHLDRCIMILNSEGTNIFQSLNPEEYRRAVKILAHAILSTDLANYFGLKDTFKDLVKSGEREFTKEENKELLKAMMMTACDVAAITKPWEVQKRIAGLVTEEFYVQGDIEKKQLGRKPIPMMDRENEDQVPKMQVEFINFICAPVYELFTMISDPLKHMSDGCAKNKEHWQMLADLNMKKKESSEATTDTGERSQENQAEDKYDEQELNKTKQDNSLNKHQVNTSLKTNANLFNNHKDNNCKVSFYHNSKMQENNRTELSNSNVNSVNMEPRISCSSTPAIQEDKIGDKEKTQILKDIECKKSSKSSKSHFCRIS